MNSIDDSHATPDNEAVKHLMEYDSAQDLLESNESARGAGVLWKAGTHSYIETSEAGHMETAAKVQLRVQPSIMGYNVQAFGADAQAVADKSPISMPSDDSKAFQAAINAAVSDGGGDIFIPRNARHYRIKQSVSSPGNVNWVFAGGVVECMGDRGSILINGGIKPTVFHSQCFAVKAAGAHESPLKIRSPLVQGSQAENTSVSTKVTRMSPEWFDGSMSEKIQKVFQTGGARTVCTVPSGQFRIDTTVDLSPEKYGSHLVLEGSSFLATTLEMPAGSSFTGIDASLSDECEIKNIRVIEARGKRTGICFALGGTTLKVHNCWAGNAKYGFFQNKGSGTRCFNNIVEACRYGYVISGNLDESSRIAGAPVPTKGVRDVVIDGGMTHKCRYGVTISADGRNAIRGVIVCNLTCKNHWEFAIGISRESRNGDLKGVVINGCQLLHTTARRKRSIHHYGAIIKNAKVTVSNSVFADNIDTGMLVDGDGHVIVSACQFGNYRNKQQQLTSIQSASEGATVEQFGVIEF